ncbi:hypothetical protein BDA96_02G020900 [Sorghum bicolor]|uniref:Alpha/beta hydrolase fold-3 domain-containing protein n=1 Tax=Sorghum bicolor TaxID=4558 RepID=A0A921RKC2_SORBI|nr:hypothetical protein BDA96_02G020900 [Sorghum bicolor]
MHANEKCVNVVVGDVDVDLYPFLLRYKDGHVERLLCSPFVAASENPTSNRGVATRDVVIDAGTGVSARLFLPCRATSGGRSRRTTTKLPLVVYIHGGSFCTESAFCRTYHRYATSLAASSGAVVVSVDYRLAPEHPIPTAYDDAFAALRWAASLADPWLAEHADPHRTFLAGDSAGGNIAYHTAVRASRRRDDGGGGIDVEGVIIVQPYFWGAERLPSESGPDDGAAVLPVYRVDRLWPFVTAGQAGNEDPRLNPPDEEIASLTCRRVLVAVAGKDTLRDRGVQLFARIRDYYARAGSRAATATLVESEGEDHGFHLYSPLRATSRKLMESIVHFINQPPQPPPPELEVELHAADAWGWEGLHVGTHRRVVLGVPSRPFRDIFDYGMDMKRVTGTACRAYEGASRIGRGNLAASNKVKKCGLFVTGSVRPNKAVAAATTTMLPGTRVIIKNFF